MALFLSGYLLAAQGDRMLMANSVEGRFPYLDHTLVEYAAGIPVTAKLPNLDEKAVLKGAVGDLLPAGILERRKHPYRAPGSDCFRSAEGSARVERYLLEDGPGWELWQREKVLALVRKWRNGNGLSQRDDSSFISVLSGRILQDDFGPGFEARVRASAVPSDGIRWRD